MARGITETDVWNACDALLIEGARPTIERVRHKIGRGSPNTVGPYLDSWFRHLGGRIQDRATFALPPTLPDAVAQAMLRVWDSALSHAREEMQPRLREVAAAAVANVEAEKERASQAAASAYDASARALRLQSELAAQTARADEALRRLAELQARLDAAAAPAERPQGPTGHG